MLTSVSNLPETKHDARGWREILNQYKKPCDKRSILELVVTALPLSALWILAWYAFVNDYWWVSLLLSIPASCFLVRLFIVQHDCGHGAFFSGRKLNDWVGRFIGVFTLTPYDTWRRSHAIHHASSGNLDRRGIGDVKTLTVNEYQSLTRWDRLKYRLYRHPLVMFVLGPAYLFFLEHRLPVGSMRAGWRPWVSTMTSNAALVLIVGTLTRLIGFQTFLLVHLPIAWLAGSIGVWLFYIQHQFGKTKWEKQEDWAMHDAALHGASHYDLPAVLHWLTGNIGIHHLHHLCCQIPFYRLPQILKDCPELVQVGRISFLESLSCVRLALWDETSRRLVSFREARSVKYAV